MPDCGASNVSLSLTPTSQSFGVGGTLDFTTTVKYDGSSKVGCLVDASTSGVVLTIKSGDDVIWKSNVCPADQDLRLIATGDKIQGTITCRAIAPDPNARMIPRCLASTAARTWRS